jgi:hypothetical protein
VIVLNLTSNALILKLCTGEKFVDGEANWRVYYR